MENVIEYTEWRREKRSTPFPQGSGFAKAGGARVRVFAFLSFAFLFGAVFYAQGVTIGWDPSPSGTNLLAYVVKYGISSGSYTGQVEVAASETTATVNNLIPRLTYYFVVTAKDTSNLESDPSNELSYTVPGSNTTGTVGVRVTPSRQVVLTVTGEPGHTHQIQATQDFTNWTVISTVTLDASGSMEFMDPNTANFPRRFYRFHYTQ